MTPIQPGDRISWGPRGEKSSFLGYFISPDSPFVDNNSALVKDLPTITTPNLYEIGSPIVIVWAKDFGQSDWVLAEDQKEIRKWDKSTVLDTIPCVSDAPFLSKKDIAKMFRNKLPREELIRLGYLKSKKHRRTNRYDRLLGLT